MPFILVAPANYPYILAGLAANFFACQLHAPLVGLSARRAAMTQEHLAQFDAEHKAAFGESSKVDMLGQPDQGTGWYSKKLGYKEWVQFNSAQRIIMNYVESFPYLIVSSLVAGFYFCEVAIACVFLTLLGRIAYAVGYKKSPQYRTAGGIIIQLSALLLMALAFASSFFFLMSN